MDDTLSWFFSELAGRVHGPFAFRFVLQPVMAMIYAAVDGFADARAGNSPYFWTMLTRPERRLPLLSEGWHRVARVIALGVLMDVLYQLIVFHWIHPMQLAVVVLGVAFLPYVFLRGTVHRIVRWWRSRRPHHRAGGQAGGADNGGRQAA